MVERLGYLGMAGPEDAPATLEVLAEHLLRLRVAALHLPEARQHFPSGDGVGMLRAEHAAAALDHVRLDPFALGVTVLQGLHAREVGERPQGVWVIGP